MRRLSIGLTLLVIVFSQCSAFAQEREKTEDRSDVVGGLTFVDRLELTVVNIDVFVTDEKGRAITDLEAADFRLFQDGQQRSLSHFAPFTEEVISRIVEEAGNDTQPPQEASTEKPMTESVAKPRADIKPVYIVLFVDNENLRPMDRNRVLNQAQRFLREVM